MTTAPARPVAPAPIRRLQPLVAAQIAAGEVIERPASVVKELIDNAIDAGARTITVDLEQGGVELIRVADDGHGIPADELPLAVTEHATSKIREAADLDRIMTMGFRGEALASIASVSRLSIRSRTALEESASCIEVAGDQVNAVKPEAGAPGTVVTVRNLFFNTPARRKFLRTVPTEQAHCVDAARDLALSHPAIAFRVRVDGRAVFDLPPDQQPRDRALALLGGEFSTQYLEVNADHFDDTRGLALWGLVGRPALARSTAKGQHLFLNGRPVRDRTIQHAIREAYRGLIEPSKHPSAVLLMVMDPGAVDVNVHPAKAEVRFRDGGLVHSAVYRAVKSALQSADLTLVVEERAAPGGERVPAADGSGQAGRLVDYLRAPVSATPQGRFRYEELRRAVETESASGQSIESASEPARHAQSISEPGQLPRPVPASSVLQVHNSYLVTQDEQGVIIIDQHALHERVMFEKLRERVDAGSLESQNLLMPAVVDADASKMEALERLGPLLEKLGISAAVIGPASIAVHSFPSFLFERGVEPAGFLGELLARAAAERWDGASATASEAALHEVLDMMACKAAVKAGDALSDTELRELLSMRERVERSSNCPHGRPTAIRMTISELEKRFGRR